MGTIQHGFHYAWESLLLDFEEVIVGSATIDSGERGLALASPLFDRPFSIVKFFHHPDAEMGIELHADGSRAILSMFRQETIPPEDSPEARPETGSEIGKIIVDYDEILDEPDKVMERVFSLLPLS
jgi:hypothetical protein